MAINVPLKCPLSESCPHGGCSYEAQATHKKVDVLFVLDRWHKPSLDFVESAARRLRNTAFAITVLSRHNGRSTDCISAFEADVRRLRPEAILFVGQSPATYFKGLSFPARGVFQKLTIGGVEYDTMQTLAYSAIAAKPSLAGIFLHDAARCADPELRALRVSPSKASILSTYTEAKDYINYLRFETKSKYVGLDTETKNLNKVYGNQLATFQFTDDGKTAYVLPWEHHDAQWSTEEQAKLKGLLRKLFTEETAFKAWILHHAKFDITQIFSRLGVLINQVVLDTQAGLWLLDENRLEMGKDGPFKLETLVREYGGSKYEGLEGNIEEARHGGSLYRLPIKQLADYGGRDACSTYQLYFILKKLAEKQNYLDQWNRQMRFYFSEVFKMFAVMECNGAKVDLAQIWHLKSPDSPIKLRMHEIEKEFQALPSVKKVNQRLLKNNSLGAMPTLFGEAPSLFDINRAESKKILFWDVLGLAPVEFGKPEKGSGSPTCYHDLKADRGSKTASCTRCGAVATGSLDKEFQTEYSEVKEVALYTEYNKLKKLSTSYVNSLHNFVDPEDGEEDCQDGRLRPNQNALGTVTSRTSTTNPNLAQIPKGRTSATKAIKDLFIPEPGNVLIQVDYATAEVRGLGIASGDRGLARIYNASAEDQLAYRRNPDDEALKKKADLSSDIHKMTGSEAFSVPIDMIEKPQRDAAKGVTFGLIYGMGDNTLAGNLNKSLKDTKEIIKRIFNLMPDAEKWMAGEKLKARTKMYVENPMGVRRRLPAFLTKDESAHARAERQSVNSEIQGMCAQFAMVGCVLINKVILNNGWDKTYNTRLINYVHDAVVLETSPEILGKLVPLLEKTLTNDVQEYCTKHFGVKFNLPLAVDIEIGHTLGNLKRVEMHKNGFRMVMKELGLK